MYLALGAKTGTVGWYACTQAMLTCVTELLDSWQCTVASLTR